MKELKYVGVSLKNEEQEIDVQISATSAAMHYKIGEGGEPGKFFSQSVFQPSSLVMATK